MTSSAENRLRSWERLLEEGGPDWLVQHAPRIIAELRCEIASRLAPEQHREDSTHDR